MVKNNRNNLPAAFDFLAFFYFFFLSRNVSGVVRVAPLNSKSDNSTFINKVFIAMIKYLFPDYSDDELKT